MLRKNSIRLDFTPSRWSVPPPRSRFRLLWFSHSSGTSTCDLSLKFQLNAAPGCVGSYRKETLDRVLEIVLLSGSLSVFVVLDGRNLGSYC